MIRIDGKMGKNNVRKKREGQEHPEDEKIDSTERMTKKSVE